VEIFPPYFAGKYYPPLDGLDRRNSGTAEWTEKFPLFLAGKYDMILKWYF